MALRVLISGRRFSSANRCRACTVEKFLNEFATITTEKPGPAAGTDTGFLDGGIVTDIDRNAIRQDSYMIVAVSENYRNIKRLWMKIYFRGA